MREAYLRDKNAVEPMLNHNFMYRRSDWFTVPGEQVSFDGVKVKTIWNQDDKYFGVPYAHHESDE